MNERLVAFYEAEFGKKLAEPESEEDVRNIISCISIRNGYLGNETETELQGTSLRLNRRFRLLASEAREDKARFTKAISNQLYDDPFHFFFELIQNADDASYSKARQDDETPCISFHVRAKEMIVHLNEDGFNLQDVIAICSTGQSSKVQDAQTTGEKGFGFKAVFGIASTVHIQSGLWSFTFNHQQHEDGIGMISPVWRQATELPAGVRTQITLVFTTPTEDYLEGLCTRLEAQPESIVGFLRNIRSMKISFENVCGRRYERCFDLLPVVKSGFQEIVSTIDSVRTVHCFLTFTRVVQDMPKCETRIGHISRIKIWWPVSDFENYFAKTDPQGQHISAYLPVCQIPQLQFLIQGDFVLPASRQAVSDNPWNRRIRDQIAALFAQAAVYVSSIDDFHFLRYQWLQFLPILPVAGFWKPLQESIRKELLGLKAFLSWSGTRLCANDLRSLPEEFLHDGHPILRAPTQKFSFLSNNYSETDSAALHCLGVQPLSSQEMLDMVIQDSLSDTQSCLHETPLEDKWHISFVHLLQLLLKRKRTNPGQNVVEGLRGARILPLRSGQYIKWRRPPVSFNIYFPLLVEEGHVPEHLEIMMPTDLGLPVLHPDASRDALQTKVYRLLGVLDCPPATVCKAIKVAQTSGASKQSSDLLAHFELLFWFSHSMQGSKLVARTVGGGNVSSNQLFLHSENQYHATRLLKFHDGQKYQEHFLHRMYQNSPVSTRTRGHLSWEQWLCQVAGARWYPPLQNLTTPGKLHWMIEAVRDENPSMFVPMLQAHWATEYAGVCQSKKEIRQALHATTVLCRQGGKAQLQDTWFPTQQILDAARRYDVQDQLPILALPDSDEGCDLTSWSCLRELDIPSCVSLQFYQKVLTTLAESQNCPPLDLARMSEVYMHIGGMATLTNKDHLQVLFSERKMIWDPQNSSWRSTSECVWDSKISLQRKFVITRSYNEKLLHGLFKVLLCIGDTTVEALVDELEGLRDHPEPSPNTAHETTVRAAQIYTLLEEMAADTEQAEKLRAMFKSQELINCSGKWQKSGSCIWHASVRIGQHIPIAAFYPDLEKFFVNVLRISTVTDKFMMKELAKAASQTNKEVEQIRSLMLSTGSLLNPTDDSSKFQSSIEKLRENNFLPCISSTGAAVFLATGDTFFITDNSRYGELFGGKLTLMNFSYQELNKLHKLFKLLQIEDRYLTKNVLFEMTEGEATANVDLTQRFQQCAYALSCCAILHQSSLYFNQSKRIHDLLREATAHTSPNLRTKYTVMQNKVRVSVDADKAYLVVKEEHGRLTLVVPENVRERNMCLKSQLPGYLARLLHIQATNAEKQIYRFVNEIDMGTDELMNDEEIPDVDWLTRTERPPPPPPPPPPQPHYAAHPPLHEGDSTPPRVPEAHLNPAATIDEEDNAIVVYSRRPGTGYYHRVRVDIPETPDHLRDAPDYQRVLAHVRSQAVRVKWRDVPREHVLNVRNDLTDIFSALTIQEVDLETSSRPSLFGSDNLSDFRIGAAGELFVFEVLKSLTDLDITLENWQSTIRHFVCAHPAYAGTEAWHGKETADIVYCDHTKMLESTLIAKVLGDSFSDWLPTWLAGECRCRAADGPCPNGSCPVRETAVEPLEWLFEVKTTIGPCETDLFMSPSQYDRMRKLGTAEEHGRKQVYCLVRVYNLLAGRIGIRFYIDPWRFRDNKLQFGTTDKWRVTAR